MSKITFNRTQVIIDYETLYEDTFGSITDKDNHLEEITNLLHGIESYDDVYNAEDPADGSEPKISLGQRNALIAALKRTATEKELVELRRLKEEEDYESAKFWGEVEEDQS